MMGSDTILLLALLPLAVQAWFQPQDPIGQTGGYSYTKSHAYWTDLAPEYEPKQDSTARLALPAGDVRDCRMAWQAARSSASIHPTQGLRLQHQRWPHRGKN